MKPRTIGLAIGGIATILLTFAVAFRGSTPTQAPFDLVKAGDGSVAHRAADSTLETNALANAPASAEREGHTDAKASLAWDARLASTGRRPIPITFTNVWSRTGSMDDTTLVQPMVLFATEDHLNVVDMAYTRVVSMDAIDGRVRWYAGRPGSGPGEFRSPQFAGAVGDHVFVWDGTLKRLTLLRGDGTMPSSISLNGSAIVKVCLLSRERVLAVVARSDSVVLRTIDVRSNEPLTEMALPWFAYQHLSLVGAQQMMTSDSDGCITGPTYGAGLARYDSDGVFRDTLAVIEMIAPPTVIRTAEGGGVRSRLSDGTTSGIIGIASLKSYLVVAFGGDSPLEGRKLDFYEKASGVYRGSLATIAPIRALTGSSDMLYVMTENDEGFFQLEALRLTSRQFVPSPNPHLRDLAGHDSGRQDRH